MSIEEILPLTPLQEGLFFQAELGDEGNIYVVQNVLHIEGPADPETLRTAASALLRRHEVLRASFRSEGLRQPVQVIHTEVPLSWTEIDLRADPRAPEEFEKIALADRVLGFDLGKAPLVRFTLVRMGPGRHRLLMTNHHINMDGWSLPTVLGELMALCSPGTSLPAVPPFRAYLAWLAGRDKEAARKAWAAFLRDLPGASILCAGQGGNEPAARPESVHMKLGADATGRLTAAARDHAFSLSSVTAALWGCLLGRLIGSRDVVFGTVVSGRTAEIPGIGAMVGLFINSVPVRVRWSPDVLALDAVARVQEDRTALLEHEHLSLAEIQAAAGLGDLFDTFFLFENHPLPGAGIGSAAARITSVESTDATHYALCLVLTPGPRLAIRLEYRPDLLGRQTAECIAARYRRLLEWFAEDPARPLGAARIAGMPDAAAATGAPPPAPATFGEIFSRRAAASADLPAVAVADLAGRTRTRTWTYGELNSGANRLAHRLLALCARREEPVAVVLRRSYEQVVALVGTLKAGAPYLPIDPDLPRSRIEMMLEDSGARIVVTSAELAASLPAGLAGPAEIVVIDRPPAAASPDRDPGRGDRPDPLVANAAYVIYTSGSTGVPKAVVVSHAGLAALAADLTGVAGLTSGSRMLQFASASFDTSIEDFLAAFHAGATLVILPEPVVGADLAELLSRESIGYVELPPSVLGTLPDVSLRGLLAVNAGGEALPRELVDRWAPGRVMINSYGPTETTVTCVLTGPLGAGEAAGSVPALGGPVSGVTLYVLDGALEPVVPGLTGELYVAGHALARGYLNRPGMTSCRFVADPFADPGARMYRTGDLVRHTADGALEFAGRADAQVKLRGFRIEPGEIEAALAALPGVRQAVVVLRADSPGDARLIGYLTADPGAALDLAAMRDALEDVLPPYLVPSAIVLLDSFPLTVSGKLDRAALPAPQYQAASTGRAPRNDREARLCELFGEVLGVEPVTIDDSFLGLGGHSLLAIRLISRIRKAFGDQLTLPQLLRAPTVAAVAGLLGPGQARLATQPAIQRVSRTSPPIRVDQARDRSPTSQEPEC